MQLIRNLQMSSQQYSVVMRRQTDSQVQVNPLKVVKRMDVAHVANYASG